jgi:hypothetical protein
MARAASEVNAGSQQASLVVQVGFTGSRQMLDANERRADMATFDAELTRRLAERLVALRGELGLTCHFLCGISQAAVGGDVAFMRACDDLRIPLRIFLPQPREEFLAAVSHEGVPDFSSATAGEVRELMGRPNVVEERVVSDSATRHERFEDANLEIVRHSDVLVCLIRERAQASAGGSLDFAERAARWEKPLLEIRVAVGEDGSPQLTSRWHRREQFQLPGLPEELHELKTSGGNPPTLEEYVMSLQAFASRQAEGRQFLFKASAAIIILTHVGATVCGALAGLFHEEMSLFLSVELLLLFLGFVVHQMLHRWRAVGVWAMSRLVAELGRSAQATSSVRTSLNQFANDILPSSLRPLLRTLSILHLFKLRRTPGADWRSTLEVYAKTRLTDPTSGQEPYYQNRCHRARTQLRWARRGFVFGSTFAFLATLAKLLMARHLIHFDPQSDDLALGMMGLLASVLPVIAVAGLSLAASFDLEARMHIYDEMVHFLKRQRSRLESASSQREFNSLVEETERRLVAENATWFMRRLFVAVS